MLATLPFATDALFPGPCCFLVRQGLNGYPTVHVLLVSSLMRKHSCAVDNELLDGTIVAGCCLCLQYQPRFCQMC